MQAMKVTVPTGLDKEIYEGFNRIVIYLTPSVPLSYQGEGEDVL